jgi:hypothetical protein
VPPSNLPFSRRVTRTLVLWLLAALLPLQGAAVGVFGVNGPLHLHRTANSPLVLEDVRRWKAPQAHSESHMFGAFGDRHGGLFAQRHHHARADRSVVSTPDEQPGADEAIGVAALSLLATAPMAAPWHLPEVASGGDPSLLSWSWCTGFTTPLERPPREG